MIEILDTTLRDGEQTSGVSFSMQEKLSIARYMLSELGIDRIEIASARVSAGEYQTVRSICDWARNEGYIDRVEVLGFVDGQTSVDWIASVGGKVINLLTKGSLRHVTEQLRRTPEQHIADIRKTIAYAREKGLSVNIYLEDWSNGMKNSPDYVYMMVDELQSEGVHRFMLPDTLGVLNPIQTTEFCTAMVKRYPSLRFDFHAHNDYDLAVANVFSAVSSGISGIHTTINGLGERAGNAPLTSVLAILHDQLGIRTQINEEKMYSCSKLVETYSGIRIPANKPIIGDNVFTQVAGVHADGDSKNNLYCNDLRPERFGRKREYALGKTSGKANIRKNLEVLGIRLDDADMAKVTQKIIELGDKKQIVTPEDMPFIIKDVLGHGDTEQSIKIVNYSLSLTHNLRPVATILVEVDGKQYQQTMDGDGQYDAFSKALRMIYASLSKPIAELLDYSTVIPPGGNTDALVHNTITWKFRGKVFKTHGLDADQTEAAIKATMKMLNLIENM